MGKQKKLVIKVNYDNAEKQREEYIAPDRFEEWDIKKIAIALLLSVVLITGFYYVLFRSDVTLTKAEKVKDSSVAQQPDANNSKSETKLQAKNDEPIISKAIKNIAINKNVENNSEKGNLENNKGLEKVKLFNHVARSQLSFLVKNKEPQGQVNSPVRLGNNETVRIYYFTELKNMSGHTVYHVWGYNGKQVFKKAINVKGPRWRISTYKNLNDASIGSWQVKLLDDNGMQLDKINFDVIKGSSE